MEVLTSKNSDISSSKGYIRRRRASSSVISSAFTKKARKEYLSFNDKTGLPKPIAAKTTRSLHGLINENKISKKTTKKIITKPTLAKRVLEFQNEEFFLSKGIALAQANRYHISKNPDGIINLGTAENRLNNKELLEKLNHREEKDTEKLELKEEHLLYGSYHGSDRLRNEIGLLLNRYFNPKIPFSKNNFVVGNGCGSLLNLFGHILFDPGDAALVPGPYYGGFDADIKYEAQVHSISVPHEKDDCMTVTYEALEKAWLEATRPVKAILISNPNNPFGRSYTKEQLLVFCNFAKDHGLMMISDEIYALSSWKSIVEKNEKLAEGSDYIYKKCSKEEKVETLFNGKLSSGFTSVFSLDLPDPEHTYGLWGFSKDFCLNGLRIGVAMSYSDEFLNAVKKVSLFTCIPTLIDESLYHMLSDHAWTDKFIQTNNKRLYESYAYMTDALDRHNIEYIDADSGFFLYIDLRDYGVKEDILWMKLIRSGLYIAPSEAFMSEDNEIERGWYRVCFAVEKYEMDESLKRLFTVLDSIKK